MTLSSGSALGSALISLLVGAVLSAATVPGDLSTYRKFRLGTNLTTVSKQVGANASQVKTIHRRPVLIQELEWRPQPFGSGAQTEATREIVFRFHDGELFLITVSYNRYGTEGLTADDLIEAISATYGVSTRPTAAARTIQSDYGDTDDVVAEWQDPQYRFQLIRSSYGPTYKLVGALKRLEVSAQAAIVEAKRLDHEEAPQRDAARKADEEEAARVELQKARLSNKPKFRP